MDRAGWKGLDNGIECWDGQVRDRFAIGCWDSGLGWWDGQGGMKGLDSKIG